MQAIPLFDIKPIHADLHEQFLDAFNTIVRSGNYILGGAIETFEQAMARYLNCQFTIGVSSGTDALLIALMALDIRPGDEVLCPSFTFFASASCIARLGATPIWVDVNASDFSIDLNDAEKKLSSRTKAIIAVHLFGQCCDCQAIQDFARKHHLYFIEDVAQAQGALYNRQQAGTWGDMGTFSFFPTKNLGGFGDSGLVSTNNPELAKRLKCLRVHGAEKRYEHTDLGGNFRMDTLQAALLNIKLPQLNTWIQLRRRNAQFYLQALQHLQDHLTLPSELAHRQHTWNQFTIRVHHGRRNELKTFLEQNNIGCAVYYPKTLDLQTCFQSIASDVGHPTKVAHKLAEEVLSLPIYPGLTEEQLNFICQTIRRFSKIIKSQS